MVIRTAAQKPSRQCGALMVELLVAMALLTGALLPLAYSFASEKRLARSYYQRAVAIEIVDGEMEALAAGEWHAFAPGVHEYRVRAFPDKSFKGGTEIVAVPDVQHQRLLPENPHCFLRVLLLCGSARIIRVHEQGDLGSRRELKKDLYSLGADLAGDGADTCDIPARTVVTRDQTDPDRVRPNSEDDGNPGCGGLGGAGRSYVTGGADDVDVERNQFCRKLR